MRFVESWLPIRALVESRHRFSSITILNWAGGLIATGQALLHPLGDLLHLVKDEAEFELELVSAAPASREIIEATVSGKGGQQGVVVPKRAT